MSCECAQLPDYDYYTPGRSLSRKIRPVTKIVARENWRELLRCEVCGTHWRIDAADKYQDRFAWKVGAFRPDWALPDFPEREKALLLQRRGGETEEKCIWLGCEKRKVRGVAYCIDHLYAVSVRPDAYEKRPKKSPEPTPTVVTPRPLGVRIESKRWNRESNEARVASAAVVAHL